VDATASQRARLFALRALPRREVGACVRRSSNPAVIRMATRGSVGVPSEGQTLMPSLQRTTLKGGIAEGYKPQVPPERRPEALDDDDDDTAPAKHDACEELELSLSSSFAPPAEIISAFKRFAVQGEMLVDDLPQALESLGFKHVEENWVSEITRRRFRGRSFLDQLNSLHVIATTRNAS